MRTLFQKTTVTIAVLSVLASTTNVSGWGPIGHYLITKEAAEAKEQGAPGEYRNANDKVEDYASLPDYVKSSREVVWLIPITLKTRREFRWSHGCIDQGTVATVPLLVYIPKKPKYSDPDDGRYPGEIMAGICKKIDPVGLSDAKKWELLNTINGFRTHNAADNIVHFEYFDGATEAMSFQERADAWVLHHGLKEVWADYVLLEEESGVGGITWTANGGITPPTGMSITLKGNAMLMQLAQKAHVRNRYHDRVGGWLGNCEFEVQTVAKITQEISDRNNVKPLKDFFTKPLWAEDTWKLGVSQLPRDVYLWDGSDWVLVNMSQPTSLEQEYERLEGVADGVNSEKDDNHPNGLMINFGYWDPADVETNYNASVTKSKTWMSSMSDVFGN